MIIGMIHMRIQHSCLGAAGLLVIGMICLPAHAGPLVEIPVQPQKQYILSGPLNGGSAWTLTDAATEETKPVTEGGVRGTDFSCPPGSVTQVTHADADFEVTPAANMALQGGFAEGEIAAVSYTIPANQFPIQIDLIEVIVGRDTGISTPQVVTAWSILVYSGFPNSGQLVQQFNSDGSIIPHLELPQNSATVINALVDPSEAEQIVIDDNGSHTFSIGFRIDSHFVPGNPCLSEPPADRNTFPSTDNGPLGGTLAEPTQNWINAVSGTLCLCGSGWFSFETFPSFCTPGGDWNIRASYCTASGAITGACCLPDGNCVDDLGTSTCAALSGVFQGNGSTCAGSSCSVLLGACCDPVNGVCGNGVLEADCLSGGGTFQGEGTDCTNDPCPEPTGACCLGGGNCLSATESVCVGGGFQFAGNGSQCPVACDLGACCNPVDGTCSELIEFDCDSNGGNFLGQGTSCMPNQCPQPTGACCNVGPSQTCFPDQTLAACAGIGDWAGPGTTCPCAGCTTPGDLDGDGDIDLIDLAEFTACFGLSTPPGCECADMDESGAVDLLDWAAIEQSPVTGP